MGLSGVVGLADWVLVVECVRRAGGGRIGSCEVWVVVCVGCGASGLRKVGLKRGVAVGIGE